MCVFYLQVVTETGATHGLRVTGAQTAPVAHASHRMHRVRRQVVIMLTHAHTCACHVHTMCVIASVTRNAMSCVIVLHVVAAKQYAPADFDNVPTAVLAPGKARMFVTGSPSE